MSFWSFCCKFPQVHRPFGFFRGGDGALISGNPRQYPNELTGGPTGGIPELDGCSDPSIDNEGDWSCLSDYAGVRSDGTLWCWLRSIESIDAFRRFRNGGVDRPIQISADTDWSFVTSDNIRGFAIKQDGSLWAFGDNAGGSFGIGVAPRKNSFSFNNVSSNSNTGSYQSRLSTGIESVSIPNGVYSEKPTVTVTGGPAGMLGSGATFDVEWSGVAGFAFLTNGGSGYTSAPTVSLVGQGADAGKTLLATTVSLTNASVNGFSVVSGGSGYTFATARLSYYANPTQQATATAIIQDGVVTGWTLTNAGGVFSVSGQNAVLQNLSSWLSISGDGTGATALPVFATRSILNSLGFPQIDMWTTIPRVEFSGGGGTGASAVVNSISGSVKSIRVLNPGAGYTQSSQERLRLSLTLSDGSSVLDFNSRVTLIPSVVTQVFTNQTAATLVPLRKQSDGKLFPFSLPTTLSSIGPPWDDFGFGVESIYLVKSDGSQTQIANNGTSSTTLTGCTYPPFLKAYYSYSPYTTTRSTGGYDSLEVQSPEYQCKWDRRVQDSYSPSYDWRWPSGSNGVSLSGVGSLETENIDGNHVTVSKSFGNHGPRHLPFEYPPPPTYAATSDVQFTGRIASKVLNMLNTNHVVNWPADVTLFRDSVWLSPTLTQKARIYFTPPTHGGTAPYAEAEPVGGDSVYGFGTSPTIISGGDGLYDVSPDSFTNLSVYESPVRVGEDTWRSVSIFVGGSYGVTTDGKLYWWGSGTTNGLGGPPCVSPAPVGQGVTVDVDGGDELSIPHLGRNPDPGFGQMGGRAGRTGRLSLGIPQHGVFAAPQDTPQLLTEEGGAPFAIKQSSDRGYVKSYFSPAPDILTRQGLYGGIGYTEQPTVEYLHPGQPAATFTARLIGPSSFTDVYEDCARDVNGVWYSLKAGDGGGGGSVIPDPFYEFPARQYEYTRSQTFTFEGVGEQTARTAGRLGIPTYISIASGGSGYTTASLSFTNSPASGFNIASNRAPTSQTRTVNSSYVCDRGGGEAPFNITTSETYVYEYKNAPLSPSQVTINLPVLNGSVSHVTYRYVVDEGVSVSPTITGDGTGATAIVVSYPQEVISRIPPVTPPGFDSYCRRLSLGLRDAKLWYIDTIRRIISSNRTYQSNFAYTTPSFVGVSDLAGRTFRKTDSSIWRVGRQSGANELNSVRAYRVFPYSLSLDSTGSGYGDVASATLAQQNGVARLSAIYSASVMSVGVLDQGYGYSSPPAITLTPADGIGVAGAATAVIAGPLAKVEVTSAGSGYRVPPAVVFSGRGVHARATCTLNSSGGVASIEIQDGGRYRDVPPAVTLEPIVQVESLSITSGGTKYRSAPDVHIGSGGGVGATATARICGVVSELTLTSPGSGYSEPPQVVFEGEAVSHATADCLLNAKVTAVSLVSRGTGYTSPPQVVFSGGGGSGAAAEAIVEEEGGGVSAINITNEGNGYRTAPTVTLVGGEGSGSEALAVIRGPVESITLNSGGTCYRETPLVSLVGGGGGGATAEAIIDGTVDQITLTSRGAGFIQAPMVVFYNGGGGSGAVATATIAAAGLGAAATATINGSVIFCTHTGSSGLQTEPTIAVSQSSNYVLADLAQKLAAGEITQEEHDAGVALASTRLKVRIIGKVSGVNVENGGTKYHQGTYNASLPVYQEDRILAFAKIRDEMAQVGTTPGDIRAAGLFDGGIGRAAGVVSGGSITSVTVPASLAQYSFWKKPEVTAIDGVSAVPKTCLTLRGAGVVQAGTPPGAVVSSSSFDYNGFRAATLPTIYGPAPDIISLSGGFVGTSFGNVRSTLQFFAPFYSPMPTLTIQDESGSGAFVGEMNSTSHVSGGSGYTFRARLAIKGGVPAAWSNRPTLQASVSDGKVTAITVVNGGKWLTEIPDIFIVGGGGSGATARVSGMNYSITGVLVTSGGQGYTSVPTVVVVDRERPAEFARSFIGLFQNGVYKFADGVFLQNAKVEFCLVTHRSRTQMTIDSPVGVLSSVLGAAFVPFFEDDGYVEDILWSFVSCGGNDGYFCGVRPFVTKPEVTATGPCEQPAQFSTKDAGWSDVFSENSIKTNP